MQNITLNTGAEMPILGLGVFQMDDTEVRDAIPAALDAGYRLIDTASRYYNEEAVGKAIAESGVPREEIFLETKLWFKDHGYEQTKEALKVHLDKLGTDYLDLWLIHQPFNDVYGSWRAMAEAQEEGLVRAIGVSNFYTDRYLDLVTHTGVVPAVNQRETHPLNQQQEMAELVKQHGTVLQAWAPLAQGNEEALNSPILGLIAQAHNKSVQQIMLRWLVQREIAMVAKSTRPERLQQNLDIFDFELSDTEMGAIAEMDKKQLNAGLTHRDTELLEMLLKLD